MRPTRVPVVLLGTLFGLAAFVLPAGSQNVFPVRFEGPGPEGLAVEENTASFQVATGTGYRNRIALTVTPSANDDLLRITASQTETTVSASVVAFARSSADEGLFAIKELRESAIYDATPEFFEGNALIIAKNAASFDVLFVASGDNLTLRTNTPAGHDLLTVWVDVFTNKPVTFTELF